MNFALTYLIYRALYRVFDFFHHWYVDASRHFAHAYLSTLENLDQTFAVKITFRYFFHPLYKDYSLMGRILGVIFRTGRIIIGLVLYVLVTVLFTLVYFLWLVAPVVLFVNALVGL